MSPGGNQPGLRQDGRLERFAARCESWIFGAVDIRRRGLAGDVSQLLRRLKLTGSRHATVVMTRVQDRPWGLICVSGEGPADAFTPPG